MAVNALCNRGDSILVPKPGFSLIKCIADSIGVNLKFYDLLPDQEWKIDLESVKRQIDSRTKAFMVINPSNPCGSVFSKEHQLEIIQLAEEYKIPLLADEVYYGIIHPGREYHHFGNLTKTLPIIAVSSISKVYSVPGWRLGWVIAYNRGGYFDELIKNLDGF